MLHFIIFIIVSAGQLRVHRERGTVEHVAEHLVPAMSLSLLLLVHRRPRADRDLDADLSLLPDQGFPYVRSRRHAILRQYRALRHLPRSGRHDVEPVRAPVENLPSEVHAVSHAGLRRERANNRGEIRKYKIRLSFRKDFRVSLAAREYRTDISPFGFHQRRNVNKIFANTYVFRGEM